MEVVSYSVESHLIFSNILSTKRQKNIWFYFFIVCG